MSGKNIGSWDKYDIVRGHCRNLLPSCELIVETDSDGIM